MLTLCLAPAPVLSCSYTVKDGSGLNDTQRVRGQMAWPDRPGKFPALIIYQWAGVYPLQQATVTGNAQKGWLAVNVMPHDLPIDEKKEFYEVKNNGELKEYGLIGRDHRETSYFRRMYLGARRVVDYVKSLPEWDGRTLVVAPTAWTVRFEKSVPLESSSGSVVNGDGTRTALNPPRHGDTDSVIVFDMPAGLTG